MSPIEASLSQQQKENLEQARRILGFRSRADLVRWFADNAVEIAQGQLTGIGFIDQGAKSLSKARKVSP